MRRPALAGLIMWGVRHSNGACAPSYDSRAPLGLPYSHRWTPLIYEDAYAKAPQERKTVGRGASPVERGIQSIWP